MKKVALHNLGCKVNACETEAIAQQFIKNGYEIVDFNEIADIYIINTCTVTSIADKKSRQMLHRAKRLNPNSTVVAVGCFVQANPEDAINDPAIDIAIGNNDKYRVFELVEEHKNSICDINHAKIYEELTINENMLHTRAFVKIQDGCNQFCSYCLIPYVRGRIRSRNAESIISEIKTLYLSGTREFVLTGIHLSSYGTEDNKDKQGPPLLKLIKCISAVIPDGRIRLGSLEPRIITDEFAKELSEVNNICPHFHLSLQSGCNETLKRMNRHYTTEEFENSVNILRKYFKHPAITTDVIVGFPGETDAEFNTTYEYLKRISLYEMHVFKFSVRKGTAAEKLPDRINPLIQEARSKKLMALSAENKKAFEKFYENTESEVLLEEYECINKEKYLTGYNREYVKIGIKNSDKKPGDICLCKGKIIDFQSDF